MQFNSVPELPPTLPEVGEHVTSRMNVSCWLVCKRWRSDVKTLAEPVSSAEGIGERELICDGKVIPEI
jgi:hypothetical protein